MDLEISIILFKKIIYIYINDDATALFIERFSKNWLDIYIGEQTWTLYGNKKGVPNKSKKEGRNTTG